jgi:hypothetical protein
MATFGVEWTEEEKQEMIDAICALPDPLVVAKDGTVHTFAEFAEKERKDNTHLLDFERNDKGLMKKIIEPAVAGLYADWIKRQAV